MPPRWRASARAPPKRTSPVVGWISVARIPTSVDLPAPFGPTSATASPAPSVRSSGDSARSRPYALLTPFASTELNAFKFVPPAAPPLRRSSTAVTPQLHNRVQIAIDLLELAEQLLAAPRPLRLLLRRGALLGLRL